jgi:hypothetical protein
MGLIAYGVIHGKEIMQPIPFLFDGHRLQLGLVGCFLVRHIFYAPAGFRGTSDLLLIVFY